MLYVFFKEILSLTWCDMYPLFVQTHNQDWPPLLLRPEVSHSKMCLVPFLLPKMFKHILSYNNNYNRKFCFTVLISLRSVRSETLAVWMALGGRCILENTKAPPPTGWQLKPGKLLMTLQALFTLWTNEVLMCCVSCTVLNRLNICKHIVVHKFWTMWPTLVKFYQDSIMIFKIILCLTVVKRGYDGSPGCGGFTITSRAIWPNVGAQESVVKVVLMYFITLGSTFTSST